MLLISPAQKVRGEFAHSGKSGKSLRNELSDGLTTALCSNPIGSSRTAGHLFGSQQASGFCHWSCRMGARSRRILIVIRRALGIERSEGNMVSVTRFSNRVLESLFLH
jgi:hypothetical protein